MRNLAGYDIQYQPSTGSKEARARGLAVQIEHGNVVMQKAHWNQVFIEELRMFPNGKHDDQVDAGAVAFNRLAEYEKPVVRMIEMF